MRKDGQVSFEYIVLFSVLLIVFLVVGSITVIGMDRINKTERDGQRLADRIKVEMITASMSDAEYVSYLFLPPNVAGKKYVLELYGHPDNMLRIKIEDAAPNEFVGKAYLPIIESVSTSKFNAGDKISISKKNNKIDIIKQ